MFYPPNVAGWPGGENWIDSSTLMMRLRIPQMLQHDINVGVKTDDDVQMGMQNDKLDKLRKVKEGMAGFANVDQEKFATHFKNVPDKDLYNAIQNALLQTKNKTIDINYAGIGNGNQSKAEYIYSTAIALVCTPEYQMC